MAETSELDINLLCRLCVQFFEKEKVFPIFNNETDNERISLSEKIKYCSAVEVAEDDGLPPQICNTCLSKLNQSFIFRNQCVLADITLKRLKHFSFGSNLKNNFLKVDIENQIIQSERVDFLQEVAVQNLKNEFRNDVKIDEFDNSKNGRHKRSIHKLKSLPLEKAKNSEKCDEKNKSFSAFSLKRKNEKPDSDTDREKLKYGSSNKAKKLSKSKKIAQTELEQRGTEDSKRDTSAKKDTTEQKPNSINDDSSLKSEEITEISKNHKLTKSKKCKKSKASYCKEKPSSYKCDYCEKVYPSEGGWRYHVHTMHNENYQPFICELCGHAFKVKKNLEVHKNSIHFHLKLNLCDLCGRGFASKYALKVHKIWHSDEKNFTCDICGTKFRTLGKMNTHRSIHGGPKKFMCHICSRDFRWKKDFEIHMRTHTGEKPFKCSNCGKAFASLSNMKKHEKNHFKKLETSQETEKTIA